MVEEGPGERLLGFGGSVFLCIYAYLYEYFGPGYGRSLQRFGVGIGVLGFGSLLFGVWGLGFWDNRESFILEAMGPFWGLMLPKSRARRPSVRNSLGFRVLLPRKVSANPRKRKRDEEEREKAGKHRTWFEEGIRVEF